jgi:hypothetical protein
MVEYEWRARLSILKTVGCISGERRANIGRICVRKLTVRHIYRQGRQLEPPFAVAELARLARRGQLDQYKSIEWLAYSHIWRRRWCANCMPGSRYCKRS